MNNLWSSGHRRRLMFACLSVQIPAPDAKWFILCCSIVMTLKRPKINNHRPKNIKQNCFFHLMFKILHYTTDFCCWQERWFFVGKIFNNLSIYNLQDVQESPPEYKWGKSCLFIKDYKITPPTVFFVSLVRRKPEPVWPNWAIIKMSWQQIS